MHNFLNRIAFSAAVATLLLSAAGSTAEKSNPIVVSERDAVSQSSMVWQTNLLGLAGPTKPSPDSRPKCPPPLKCPKLL
jgi:hypothetical protein